MGEQGLIHDIQFATLPCSVVLTIQLTDRTYVGALLEQFSGSPFIHKIPQYPHHDIISEVHSIHYQSDPPI